LHQTYACRKFAGMRLDTFLAAADLTQGQFGERIGVSGATVSRYCAGVIIPPGARLAAILRETRGQVRPEDFFHSGCDNATATQPANNDAVISPHGTVAGGG
jgi:transcriptional regulator with XRE-family HTH domain